MSEPRQPAYYPALGTPKTLEDAIGNGLVEGHLTGMFNAAVKKHVVDFMRQKFGAAYLRMEEPGVNPMSVLEQLAFDTGVK